MAATISELDRIGIKVQKDLLQPFHVRFDQVARFFVVIAISEVWKPFELARDSQVLQPCFVFLYFADLSDSFPDVKHLHVFFEFLAVFVQNREV